MMKKLLEVKTAKKLFHHDFKLLEVKTAKNIVHIEYVNFNN